MLVHHTPILSIVEQISQVDIASDQYSALLQQLIPKSDYVNYDPDILKSYSEVLAAKIEDFAMRFSPVYSSGLRTITKSDLRDNCDSWFTKRVKAIPNKTSGSTEQPLRYELWDMILSIERDLHYNIIAQEFAIPNGAKIVLIDSSKSRKDFEVSPSERGVSTRLRKEAVNIEQGSFNRGMWIEKYGFKQQYTTNFGIRNASITVVGMPIDTSEIDDFCIPFFNFIQDADLVTAKGSILRILAEWLKNHEVNPTKAVIATTYDNARDSDIEIIRNSGAFRGVCDHMKACDGGMTFIMCKFGTRHLLENHAKVVEEDGEFICTDYFSLAAPFVRYKNGDAGSIGETSLCECGRYSRKLTFGGRKSFTVKNLNGVLISSIALDDKIVGLGDIVQAVYKDGHIHIRSNKPINNNPLPGFNVTTEIGNFHKVGRSGKIPRFVKWQ